MYRLLPFSLLFVLAASPLAAQDPAGSISLRLRPITFISGPERGALYLHDLAAEEATPGVLIKLKNYLNHEAVNFSAFGRKLVVTAIADPASARKPETVLGTIALPDRMRSAVLLFLPAGKATTFKIVPLDDSVRGFPRGSIRVLNLSQFNVRMQLEDKAYNLKAGENRVIEEPPMGENNHAALRMHVFRDKEWKQIGASILPDPGTRRLIQILYENPVTGRVELKGIRDVSIME